MTGDLEGVLASNVLAEANENKTEHFQWVMQSYYNSSYTSADYEANLDPKHLQCIKSRDIVYFRNAIPHDRWLTGDGLETMSTGKLSNVQTRDINSGTPDLDFFQWFFEN